MKHSIIYFICFFILTGCAVTPISSIQRANDLQINLSGSDKDVYALVDQNKQVISLSSGEHKVLKFIIPQSTRADQCFSVLNRKGVNFIKDTPQFRLQLVQEFREIAQKKQNIENKMQENIRNEQKYRNLYSTTLSTLKSNRAFHNGSCYLPPEEPIPAEPYTACNSYEECFQDGSVYCYSKLFGTETCGNVLRNERIPGMLSAPGCGAWAAKITNEKYDMDDALRDFLHGFIDDIADSKLASDSGSDNFWGAIFKFGNYAFKLRTARQCRDKFVEINFGPRRQWLADVNHIKSAPQRIKNQCFALAKKVSQYIVNIDYYTNANNSVPNELNVISSKYNLLLKKESGITNCNM